MAIQTRGFEVTNIPRFTPVDPTLVAFNPAQITNGFSQGVALVDQFRKMQAAKRAQDELNALQQQRMAAVGAGYNASAARDIAAIPTFQPAAALDIVRSNEGIRSLPTITSGQMANAQGIIDTVPGQTLATNAQNAATVLTAPVMAKATNATNQNVIDNAAVAGALQRSNAGAQMTQNQTVLATEPLNRVAILQGLSQKVQNAKSDYERSLLMQQADLELKQANAREATSRAGYYDRGGAAHGGASRAQEQARIIGGIKNLGSLPVSNGVSFSNYLNNTRDENGKPRTELGWWDKHFGGDKTTATDPLGELYFKQLQEMQGELQSITSGPPTTTPQPGAAGSNPFAAYEGKLLQKDGKTYRIINGQPVSQ